MRKSRIAIAAVVVVGSALMVALAVAGPGDGSHGGRGFGFGSRPLGRMFEGSIGRVLTLRAELNLSAEQREKIEAVISAHKAELRPAFKAVATARRALKQQVLSPTPDETAIRAAAAQVGQAAGDTAVLCAQVAGEIRQLLTPEQIERLHEFSQDQEGAVDRWLGEMAGQ